MEIADLRAFLRVADLQSLSAAARAIDIPKSSVSRSVARLEAAVGSQLFERASRALRLTDAGRLLMAHAARILDDVDEAQAALEGLIGVARGLLRVAATQAFTEGLIAPMLPAFLARHPEVRVHLGYDDRRAEPLADGTDLVVRVGPPPDSSLVARVLPPVDLWLCASPDYLARRGTPKSVPDLDAHDLVVWKEDMTWEFHGKRGGESVAARGRAVVPDAAAMTAVVVHGGGIARLPNYLAAPHVADGRLVRVLRGVHAPAMEIHALYPSHRSLSVKVRVFIDALAEHLTTVVLPHS